MQLTITMKDPDGIFECIRGAVQADVSRTPGLAALNKVEREHLIATRHEAIAKAIGKWFRDMDYLTVDIDTETMSCVVREGA